MNRRQVLARLGIISAGALIAGCATDDEPATSAASPTSTASPTARAKTASGPLADRFDAAATCGQTVEQTEGPFYIELDRIRTDVTEGRPGTPLHLGLRVRDASSCEPLANAAVEIWHCDAAGAYSGFDEEGTFLRGTQVTNADGIAQFRTLYPGWYPGRTAHIHVKVLLDGGAALTTQLYFDDAISDQVYATAPYEPGRDATNDTDGIYDASLVLTLSEEDEGYLGLMTFDVAV